MSTQADAYEIWLSADPSSPSKARDFVCGHLLAHGLERLAEDIRLVVSELATNAVRHAGSAFTVGLEIGDRAVLVSVWDSSPFLPARLAGEPTGEGGRGLFLVEALSSEWGVAAVDGSKTVWATFNSDGRTSVAVP